MKKPTAILITLGILTASVFGDDYEDALNVYRKKEYKKAAEGFGKACDRGNASACDYLGSLYENGEGVRQDDFEATILYRKGCDGGSMLSCSSLGHKYLKGKGVIKDGLSAAEMFKKACDGGQSSGCTSLGTMYYDGKELKHNDELALKYYRKACDMQHETACEYYYELKRTGN